MDPVVPDVTIDIDIYWPHQEGIDPGQRPNIIVE